VPGYGGDLVIAPEAFVLCLVAAFTCGGWITTAVLRQAMRPRVVEEAAGLSDGNELASWADLLAEDDVTVSLQLRRNGSQR
jgi:hypothetical protein